MTATVPMTAEEFAQWDAPGDYELVDGEPVSLPGSSPLHNLIRFTLAKLLMIYLDRTSTGTLIGETDCIAGANTIRRPDLSVFLGADWARVDVAKAPTPAPTIVIEVLSPTDLASETGRKVREYLGAGSQEVWLLDPANGEIQVRTHAGIRLLEGSALLESPLLPGFSAPVASILSVKR